MNSDLSRSFKDIVSGLLSSQFNVEIRSARFKDILISTMIQFAFLLVSSLVFGKQIMAIVLGIGLVFVSLTYLYHVKTDVNRVDLKAGFFIFIYTLVFISSFFLYCGRESLGAALFQTQIYFTSFFILKMGPALLLAAFETGLWMFIYNNFDVFKALGFNATATYEFDMFFTISAYLMVVITIGSVIAKTIGAYDKEQVKAKELFDDYNKQLYRRGTGSAYNDRYLLSNVATLGVLTEKGDIPGFTAVMLSVDNVEVLYQLTKEEDESTFNVFSRKVLAIISEDEVFVRQGENSFALLLNIVDPYEIEERLNELLATVNMTIFEYLPKDRITLSAGYSIHTAGKSTATTMKMASDNLLSAKKKGGNCFAGGNS